MAESNKVTIRWRSQEERRKDDIAWDKIRSEEKARIKQFKDESSAKKLKAKRKSISLRPDPKGQRMPAGS